MTANKMPEMPEALAWIHGDDLNEIHEGIDRKDAPAFASPGDVDPEYRDGMAPLYTADQMRAMYLAGLEAAKSCVPTNWCDPLLTGDKAVIGKPPYGCPDIEAILGGILTNLAALEQEAKK